MAGFGKQLGERNGRSGKHVRPFHKVKKKSKKRVKVENVIQNHKFSTIAVQEVGRKQIPSRQAGGEQSCWT